MTDGPPLDEPESGLPGKQGEFTISFPWPARFALTAAVGAVVGYAASTFFKPQLGVPAADWMVDRERRGCGGVAVVPQGSQLAHIDIRRWYDRGYRRGADLCRSALQPDAQFTGAALGEFLYSVLLGFIGMLISVPCGWIAGFGYHLALSAAEKLRARGDEPA